jgi:hypothetical protein
VHYYQGSIDPTVVGPVDAFWDGLRPEQTLSAQEDDEDEESKDSMFDGARVRRESTVDRHHRPVDDDIHGGVKREPASFLGFHTIMQGHRVVIDLTRVGDDDAEDNVDALQAQLAGNFLEPVPSASVDSNLKRKYRLKDENISETLKEQCIRFGEWRSALWNWSRDEAPVSATTFGGNISNLLLFAGYATELAPIAHRIKVAFDLSVVFGSQAALEPLLIGYLRWLRRERRVMYSTTLGYLHSLVVFAKLYFADPANSSFDAGNN